LAIKRRLDFLPKLTISPGLVALLCATLMGCAPISGVDVAPIESTAPPDEKKVASAAADEFQKLKLAGSPEVSALAQAHGVQPGDWFVCLKGSGAEKPRYSMFFRGNDVTSVRFSVVIDGCDHETYRSIAPPPQENIVAGHVKATPQ
jgi:hypothetical protein